MHLHAGDYRETLIKTGVFRVDAGKNRWKQGRQVDAGGTVEAG